MAPTLLAIGFILNLYLGNITELDLPILLGPLSVAIVGSLVLTVVSAVAFKNRSKGIVFSSVVIVAFFALGNWPVLGLLVIGVGAVSIFKIRKHAAGVSKYLLVLAIIFVGFAGVRIASEEIGKAQAEVKSPLNLPAVARKENMPDIYYIVPDSYSASSSLLKYYGYDNGWFEKALKNKGFYIATESASNYPKTFVSLGSSLNMEYLDFMRKNKASKNLSLLDPLLENNIVVKFLKSLGYDYYHLGSWWGATHTNRNATQNVILENERGLPISQFDYTILQSTMLGGVIDKILPKVTVGDSDVDRMARADYQFKKLGELASKPGPKFVFAHIIAPHEPYFYGKKCVFVTLAERKKIKEEVKYTNHLNCVNQKLLGSVNEILKKSPEKPVIIIQSDEGAPFLAEELTPPDSWGRASDALLNEKFFVFNAYFLPDGDYSQLYPQITPVNSFRLIFNKYLGTKFPILPDKSYILPDLKHLYDFVDVTDIIRK